MALASWRDRVETLETRVATLYVAFRDSRTPLSAKLIIVLIVAYAASPIDPIPDVIPGLGYLDELIVLPVGVAIAYRLISEPVITDRRERAGDEVVVGRVRWIGAGLVVVLWILIGVLLVRWLTDWL